MIKTHNQLGTQTTKNKSWNVGELVNVGFMKGLKVLSVAQIKDGKPDIYTLESAKGIKYEFTPHNGLSRIS